MINFGPLLFLWNLEFEILLGFGFWVLGFFRIFLTPIRLLFSLAL